VLWCFCAILLFRSWTFYTVRPTFIKKIHGLQNNIGAVVAAAAGQWVSKVYIDLFGEYGYSRGIYSSPILTAIFGGMAGKMV
jgi:uncharacterized BrkB/YihY/UPF0761 family membrane protein